MKNVVVDKFVNHHKYFFDSLYGLKSYPIRFNDIYLLYYIIDCIYIYSFIAADLSYTVPQTSYDPRSYYQSSSSSANQFNNMVYSQPSYEYPLPQLSASPRGT